jgi:hypothetical protein
MTDTLGRILIIGEKEEECSALSRLCSPGAATFRTLFPPAPETDSWTAVILVAPCCRSPLAREGVLEAVRRRLADRTILVTRYCPDNALGLPELPPVRVVWLETMEESLPGVLASLAARRPTRQLHALLRQHFPDGCSELQDALDVALLREPVPGDVEQLARAAGLRVSRLRRLWKAAGLPHRPEALVDLGLLGRLPSSLGRRALAGSPLATSAIRKPHFCH